MSYVQARQCLEQQPRFLECSGHPDPPSVPSSTEGPECAQKSSKHDWFIVRIYPRFLRLIGPS
eukprot:395272-Prorocentrum_minimum.AAC.2